MADVITPPNTVAQLSHAVTIRVNGKTIGAISEWNPRQTRTITELYELGDGTSGGYSAGVGVPFEKVPGNLSGMSVEVRRYDLYPQQMELRLWTSEDLTQLAAQLTAFDVRESWKFPAQLGEYGGSIGNGYADLYSGCWFSDVGKNLSATSDRVVNVNATLQWTRKQRIPI